MFLWATRVALEGATGHKDHQFNIAKVLVHSFWCFRPLPYHYFSAYGVQWTAKMAAQGFSEVLHSYERGKASVRCFVLPLDLVLLGAN
jgi:hypothetical protein